MPIPPRKLSERRGSATDRQKSYALLLARKAIAVGYPVDFGLDPIRGIESASMKDASMLIDRLKKAKEAGWPGSRVSTRAEKVSGARKKKSRAHAAAKDDAVARARAAEAKLATIARTRRPTSEETREALEAYAEAAKATQAPKHSSPKKKSARQLDAEIAEALRAWRDPDTGSAFHDFLVDRFPSGDVPWPWVQKILKGHGVPLPLMLGLGKEHAEEYGIRQGKPADVHQLARFLGY